MYHASCIMHHASCDVMRYDVMKYDVMKHDVMKHDVMKHDIMKMKETLVGLVLPTHNL